MDTDDTRANSQKVLQFIEYTVRKIEEQLRLRPPGEPSVTLKRITRLKPRDESSNGQVQWVAEDHEVTYSFPGRTKEEAWRFACVLRILSEIQSAVCENVIVTKRDIFYHDPALFLKQEVVDSFIDDVAHTCKVRRSDLNVIASPKGLVIGPQAAEDGNGPQTIPTSIAHISLVHLSWVLVVEKEASFNTLVEQKLHLCERVGRGLIVTVGTQAAFLSMLTAGEAKGYPDLATRRFLREVIDADDFTGRVFGLFDYDAYGIDILKCYRVGSKASACEKALAIPEMNWVGIKGEDIVQLESGTLTLTQADRAKAQKLLEGCLVHDSVASGLMDFRAELQTMLMLNKKAEIEAIDGDQRGLGMWLGIKILKEF